MFIGSTPTEDIQNTIQQTGENAQKAMVWFAVIAVIVLVIMFAGKK